MLCRLWDDPNKASVVENPYLILEIDFIGKRILNLLIFLTNAKNKKRCDQFSFQIDRIKVPKPHQNIRFVAQRTVLRILHKYSNEVEQSFIFDVAQKKNFFSYYFAPNFSIIFR